MKQQIVLFITTLFLLLTGFQLSATPVSADYCDQFVTSNVCNGQPSYDSCALQYDGNRAFYDCHASAAPTACAGKIYCSLYDKPYSQDSVLPSNINPATNQPMAPTCDAVRTQNLCGKTMYEGCTLRYSGNEAWYDCTSPQNSQCQGSQRCESLDKTSTTAPATGEGTNATLDCPADQHHSDLNNQTLTNCVVNTNNNGNLNANGNANSNNNNNGSSSTATAIAYGGAGGSANVNITGLGGGGNGGGTNTVQTVYRNVGVGTSAGYYAGIKQLPATGLPALAWTALGLIPTGFGLRRFSIVKKEAEKNPNYLWENRQFKAGS